MMAVEVDRLRQILDTRKLAILRSAAEVAGELAERVSGSSVAARLRGLCGAREVGRHLLRDLAVLGRVRLLKLL